MSRKGAEFNQRTRDRALNKAGLKNGEVHHKVSIRTGRKRGIAPDLLRSPLNAEGLTASQHRERHRSGSEDESFIDFLLSLLPRLPGM